MWSLLWLWCCLLAPVALSRALELSDLFQFGAGAGDARLQPGSDSTAELSLHTSVFYFGAKFDKVYINTNGLVAFEKPPPEGQYLSAMPAAFKMVAVLLGDLDNSDGRGSVYFRQDSSPGALQQAGQHVKRAFPGSTEREPVSTLVVTWEKMAAAGAGKRGDGPDGERNTFQLVVASTGGSSYAILMFPQQGLQFLSTTIGGRSHVLQTGFNEGLVEKWFWRTQGTYFRCTTEDEATIRNLLHKTTSGQKGVWVYEIGSSSSFSITPGMTSEFPKEEEMPEPAEMAEDQQDVPTQTPNRNQTSDPEPGNITRPSAGKPDHVTAPPTYTFKPNVTSLDPSYYANQAEMTSPSAPRTTAQTAGPSQPQLDPRDPDPMELGYPDPEPERPAQMVVVDEDLDLDVDVFSYSLQTCANNVHRCSASADCHDHSHGYCCRCRPGFYGNGKACLAEGSPQRVSGKLNGRVFIGEATSPEELRDRDLHAYVVVNEGRTYLAISGIGTSLGPALRLLPELGAVIGWAFALEQLGSWNGFSITGGEFSRQAEVLFLPGQQRLSIRQRFSGIDNHGHLVLDTQLEGRLPTVPPGSSVQISPYQEVYHYHRNFITSSSKRGFAITFPDGSVQNRTCQWRQHIAFESCPHEDHTHMAPSPQQLSVDQMFVMFDPKNKLMRYAMSTRTGWVHGPLPEPNSCSSGTHGCDLNAVCRPGHGVNFTCHCAAGFTGDGRSCHDIDECVETPLICGSASACTNLPGTFRCHCTAGFKHGEACAETSLPVDHCQTGSHDCDVPERAFCSYSGGSAYNCSCLPGFVGDGRVCRDDDECLEGRCHLNATCFNTLGSYACRCNAGFHGDGFQCSPSERQKSQCERHRELALAASPTSGPLASFRPRPVLRQYVPQCDTHGAYESTQCHTSIGQCWCVDATGREIPNTRTGPGSTPLCIEHAVMPAPVGPKPRPDVQPVAAGTHLLFAQSGRIEHVPLDGYRMKTEEAKPLLHIPDRVVVAMAFDCVEKMVYWSDITAPSISRAGLSGGHVSAIVTKDLESPEGIAVDHVSRLLFWTDSLRDTVEVSKLDGSQRRVLFHTELVNPRPIVTNPVFGQLYWADWNRDGPKIEMSNMDGTDRTILVKDGLGLPNGLTFDLHSQQLCWADAGTRKVECIDPQRRSRTPVLEAIQYPFALISFGRNLYYTDWRREALIAVDSHSRTETEEFLPQKRSRLYGLAVTLTQCPQVYNYCTNNGGCSHLCLPRLGGFTCRCPDGAMAAPCADTNL